MVLVIFLQNLAVFFLILNCPTSGNEALVFFGLRNVCLLDLRSNGSLNKKVFEECTCHTFVICNSLNFIDKCFRRIVVIFVPIFLVISITKLLQPE